MRAGPHRLELRLCTPKDPKLCKEEGMQRELWKTEPSGVLSSEVDGLRLVVQAPKQADGPVRFLVLRQATNGGLGTLVGSGSETGVQAAIIAAEQMANRCRGFGTRPVPTSR